MDKEQLEGLQLKFPYTNEDAYSHGRSILIELSRTLYETINHKMSDLRTLTEYLEESPFSLDGLLLVKGDKAFFKTMEEKLGDIDLDLRIYDRWVRNYLRKVNTLIGDDTGEHETEARNISAVRHSIAHEWE